MNKHNTYTMSNHSSLFDLESVDKLDSYDK